MILWNLDLYLSWDNVNMIQINQLLIWEMYEISNCMSNKWLAQHYTRSDADDRHTAKLKQ